MRPCMLVIIDCGTTERIRSSMVPEVKAYIQKGYGIVVITHLGRPHGYETKLDTSTILNEVAKAIGINNERIIHVADYATKSLIEAKDMLARLEGDLVLLQNARFDKRNQSQSVVERTKFARQIIASFCPDMVLWNNLPTAHRQEAYVCELVSLARKNKTTVKIGENVSTEISAIDRFMSSMKDKAHPVGLFGGVKEAEKRPFAEWFSAKYNGETIAAGKWAAQYRTNMPIFVTDGGLNGLSMKSIRTIVNTIEHKKTDAILLCGTPDNIKTNKVVVYVIFEAIYKAIVRGIPTLICGGDTADEFLEYVQTLGISVEDFKRLIMAHGGFISNAGGAAIEYIMGHKLPGLTACGYK